MSTRSRNSREKRAKRTRLFAQSQRCCFCRSFMAFDRATLEHIIPLAHGGSWELSNLRLSCSPCNHERGTEDFHSFMARKRLTLPRKTTTKASRAGEGEG